MDDLDLDTYFPRATLAQRAAVKAYHGAGWTIEMSYQSEDIEISRPCAMDCMDHAWIKPGGAVIPL